MMAARRTFSSLAFAGDTDNPDLPVEWARDAAIQILDWLWRSFDKLRTQHLVGIELTQSLDQLERDLTKNHFIDLQHVVNADTGGFTALSLVHESPEHESLSSPSAKPPTYDFAFVHYVYRRWAWPIEAKVLPTPGTLAEYLGDVLKFESGIAGPLVGEAGMIGYLLTGTAEVFLENLQERLPIPLEVVTEFASRSHRASRHSRRTAPPLRLHHMIMVCC